MITVRLVGDSALLVRYGTIPKRVEGALRQAIEDLSITLQRTVKQKLSGEVLNTVTGNLRSSINRQIYGEGAALSASVGTNVIYAAMHEYGFTGDETVRAHIRRNREQMSRATKTYTNKFGTISKHVAQTGKYGRSTGAVAVGSFTRHMVMPERSFLRSSLQEMAPTIRKTITKAIMAEVRSK